MNENVACEECTDCTHLLSNTAWKQQRLRRRVGKVKEFRNKEGVTRGAKWTRR